MFRFPISYGIFQEFYTNPTQTTNFSGNSSSTGVIGTTLNGIIYLSMPLLFGMLGNRLTHLRTHALVAGIVLAPISILASAFVTSVSGLIATQGVLQAFGSTLLYSASSIYIDEWYIQRKGFAFGIILSAKSSVGVAMPLVFSSLLYKVGFRTTMLIWAGIVVCITLPAPFILRRRIPLPPTNRRPTFALRNSQYGGHQTSWAFLTRHRTFPTLMLSNIIFAMSYGMPLTYIGTFAASNLNFSPANSALILVALNVPSIFASLWFGPLSDGEPTKVFGGRRLNIHWVNCLSALGSALPILFLWGMVPSTSTPAGIALLTLFAVIWGFFAGGYSTIWGGIVKEVSAEAQRNGCFVNTGLVMGMLNGGRGLGYILGGLAGVQLLKVGSVTQSILAYGTGFGSVILFAGCGAVVSGLGVAIKHR